MTLNSFIIIIGIGSIAMRVIPGLLMRNITMPTKVYQAMAFVPITIFTAMIASDIFYWDNHLQLNPLLNIKLLATLPAIMTAYYTKDIIKTIMVGIGTLTLLYFTL